MRADSSSSSAAGRKVGSRLKRVVRLRWALQMHPHALFQRRAFGQMILDGLEDSSHVSAASFQHFRRKAARSASVSRQSAADGLRGTIRITVHAVTPFRRSRAACPKATPFILRPFPAIVNGVCRKKSENGASYLLSASPVPSGNRINGTQMLSQMLFLCCFRRKFQRIRRICRRILFFLWLFYKISV